MNHSAPSTRSPVAGCKPGSKRSGSPTMTAGLGLSARRASHGGAGHPRCRGGSGAGRPGGGAVGPPGANRRRRRGAVRSTVAGPNWSPILHWWQREPGCWRPSAQDAHLRAWRSWPTSMRRVPPGNSLAGWRTSMLPQWLEIVTRAEPMGDDGNEPAWAVDLRGRMGPLARSKRLRMVRTGHDVPCTTWCSSGRSWTVETSPWMLRADVEGPKT